MPRGLRQLKLIEIVNSNNIETQTELSQLLTDAGFDATQATISRDIKELGIVKVMTASRRFRYVYGESEKNLASKFSTLFKESVICLKSAQNIVVVKTMVGSANSACAFIDNLEIPEIIGTIAGDDTVMLVIDNERNVEPVKNVLEGYMA